MPRLVVLCCRHLCCPQASATDPKLKMSHMVACTVQESTIVQVLAMPSERMPRRVACTLQDTALCSKCLHRPPASTTIQKIKLPHMVACTMRATMRGVLVSGFVVPPGGQCKHLHRKTVL